MWAYFYWAILVYPQGPYVYLALVRTPCKTVFQTAKLAAIMLTDLLMVGLLLARLLAIPKLTQRQIYRTYILWESKLYVIAIPCLTFVATFGVYKDVYIAKF